MTITIFDHQLPYETHNLYDITFFTHQIHTLVTHTPSMVDSWLTQHTLLQTPSQPSIVGLDVEWRPNVSRQDDHPVAVLQICVGPNCLVYQILHSPTVPQSLKQFLSSPSHRFVGVGIQEDVEKLLCDYGFGVSNAVDLRELAVRGLGSRECGQMGLKGLAKAVLGLDVDKPKSVSRSRWDNPWLTPVQVQYACLDAFLSYQIGTALNVGAS